MSVKGNDNKSDNKINRWIIAANKAREEIAKAKARIRQLEKSVVILTKKAESGESWPGEQMHDQVSGQQHEC